MFYAAIAPLLPAYQDDLGLSKTAAGVLSASYAAGHPAGRPAGGMAGGARRRQADDALRAGLLSGSSLVFGLAESIVLLDAARFVQGVGGACSWAGGLAWLLAVAPRERRGELIGAALGAAIFGVLLGPVLGGAATRPARSWSSAASTALGVALFAWALSTPAGPREEQATWSESRRGAARPPAADRGVAVHTAGAVLGRDRRARAAAARRARRQRPHDRRGLPGGRLRSRAC